mgnify:CR=1 FL=1
MGTETTFAGLIAAPESEKVFLCEVKPAELVTNFTLTAGKTYTYELSYLNETVTLADASTETIRKVVNACELDGTALTAKTSIATVEGTAGTYWHDAMNSLLYVHPPDDGSPNHHTVIAYFWVYFATKGIVLDNPACLIYKSVTLTGAASGSSGITVADDADIDFGTGNFTLVWKGSQPNWIPATSTEFIFKSQNAANRWTFYAGGASKFKYYHAKTGGTTVDIETTGIHSIADGTTVELTAVIVRETALADGSIAFYINGVLFETVTIPAGTPADISNSGSLQLMSDSIGSGTRKAGTVLHSYAFNRALSAAEVLSVYNTGIAVADKWGNQTTPTPGCVLALDPVGIQQAGWLDSSTNDLDASWPAEATLDPDYALYYEPYIAENGIPSLSQESQQIHWGASQISSGSVVLQNGRGFFDQIAKRWIWNNKDAKILLGGDSLAYGEYTCLFAGKVMQSTFTKENLTLDIESKSFALLRSLPINNFWTSTWANLDPQVEGKPIPYYWGSYSALQAPVVTCINSAYAASTYQFKICDCAFHAIKSITQVYVDLGAGAGWATIAHANEDLTNGTFTINSASFILGTSRVKVAFEGYHVASVLIDGAPEFVEDLLTNQCGYVAADLNAASFTASKTISSCTLNVAIENETSALTIIETACQSDLAFFDEDGAGLLRYRTWEPTTSGTLPVLAKEDILEPPEIVDDTSRLFWKVKVGYSWQGAVDEYLYTEASNDGSRYKYGRSDYLTIGTYLRSKADADQLAGRLNWVSRDPSPVISVALKAGQIDKTLGDKIKVTLARAPYQTAGGYDERVFEIISKDVSCFPLFVSLRGRDLMDFGNNVGFWMAATAPDWATATAQEKEDSGFWCDANGYCLTADTASLNKSLWW